MKFEKITQNISYSVSISIIIFGIILKVTNSKVFGIQYEVYKYGMNEQSLTGFGLIGIGILLSVFTFFIFKD